MKRIIRRATKLGYKYIAKPVLFKQHPDNVHHRLIRAVKVVQKIPGVRNMPQLWAHNSPMLRQNLLGIDFANPVGLAAGFDKNVEMATVIRNLGFGFMTGGSVTAKACDGNPKPWFYRLPKSKSLVVYAGLPNQGVQKVVSRVRRYPRRLLLDFPLVISVAKTNSKQSADDGAAIEDYCESLRVLEGNGVCRIYEINISCPNTFGGEPFTTPERLEKLLSAIDALELMRPVTIKMPIDKRWAEFRALLDVVVRHNVQAVTIGNLYKDRAGLELQDDLPADVKGGLSGAPTRAVTTKLISQTYKNYGDKLMIIGVGGVFTADDAYEKIKAGASLVALITGMIFYGPQVVGEINDGLEKLLKQDGFRNVSDAIGSKHNKKSV